MGQMGSDWFRPRDMTRRSPASVAALSALDEHLDLGWRPEIPGHPGAGCFRLVVAQFRLFDLASVAALPRRDKMIETVSA